MKNHYIIIFSVIQLIYITYSIRTKAESNISGIYEEGDQKVTVDIQSWGEDCGPKPKSYSTKGGKTVEVQLKGDDLIFSDGNSTKNCWSANTRLKKLSASKKGNTWTVICETPVNDSRHEHGEYSVMATENGLIFINKSTYNWQLKESICKAVITIRKNYKKILPEKAPEEKPPAKDTVPPVSQPQKCNNPGNPVRITISPQNSTIGPGEKVCFTVNGIDQQGCKIPLSASFSFSGPTESSDSSFSANCFIAGKNAALSEGNYKIIARTDENLSATARVKVKFGSYEDLIAVNLNPVNTTDNKSAEYSVPQSNPPAGFIMVQQKNQKSENKLAITAIIIITGIITVCCGIITLLIIRARNAKRRLKKTVVIDNLASENNMVKIEIKPDKLHEEKVLKEQLANMSPPGKKLAEEHGSSNWVRCEVCLREFEKGYTRCPFDGSELKPYVEITYESIKGGMICPVCRRGFQKDANICPFDKVHLIPYSVFRSTKNTSSEANIKTKVCPVCGKLYDENEYFCGSDGTKLVPVQ